jgi:hypothetical protein
MSVEGPDTARAVEIDHELQGLYTRMAELHGERAGMAGSLGAASLNGATGELGWLADGYAAAKASLPDLGFTEPQIQKGVPALEQVQEALAPVTAWLGMRTSDGHEHEVIIAPSVQRIGLMGTNRWPGLIPRFDKLQSLSSQTQIWPRFWTERGDKDLSHDGLSDVGSSLPFSVAILLGDISNPIDTQRAANNYNDPGGVHPDLCADEQRFMLLSEQVAHIAAGRVVAGVEIGQIIAANARRRRDGQAFLSTGIITRLVQHPHQEVVSPEGHVADWIPAVRVVGQQQVLGGSPVEAIQDDIVVRRVLKLDFSKQG